MLKYKSQKGFTIVELLIVIVVIGILAALVLNTFAGVQERARDTERQTDVNSISTQLEVYYNDNGGYPTFAQIGTEANALALMDGIDEGALRAPGVDAFSLVNNATPSEQQYGYVTLPAGCATDACDSYSLHYIKESEDNAIQTKTSLNN